MEEKDDTTLGNEMSLEEFMQYLKSIEERSDREDELLEFYNKERMNCWSFTIRHGKSDWERNLCEFRSMRFHSMPYMMH